MDNSEKNTFGHIFSFNLTWSTELAALRGSLGDSTLLHLGVFTDGTALILGIVEARSSPGGEGVFVVWYSRAALT